MLTLFFLILKFICCQFAACLFYGISLIKYFLFSPLSPWLLTLLPTLTIVCCGKFLLVEFFFPFSAPFPPTSPFCFVLFCFTLWNPQFHFNKELCQQQHPPHGTTSVVLPTTSIAVSWVWHQSIPELSLNTPSERLCVFIHGINIKFILLVCFPVKKIKKKIFSCHTMSI